MLDNCCLEIWGRGLVELGWANLESTADTEDTVIGLLGGETLDSPLDGLALLGDQVVGPR